MPALASQRPVRETPAATTTSAVAAAKIGMRLVSAASQPLATRLERIPSHTARPNAAAAIRRDDFAPSLRALYAIATRKAITTAAQIARKAANEVEEAG